MFEPTQSLLQLNLRELHVDLSVNLVALGLLPSRLGSHDIRDIHHTLLKAKIGATQILLGACQIAVGHEETFLSFLDFESALRGLEVDLLLCIGQIQTGYRGSGLGSTHLILAVHPSPNGNRKRDTDIPYAGKLTLKSVEDIGIADHVSTCEKNMGQILGKRELGILLAHVDSILQQPHLRAL